MKKEKVLVTFINGDERKVVEMNKGETILLKGGKRITVGVTPNDMLGPNIKVEEIPKKSVKSLLLKKKNNK